MDQKENKELQDYAIEEKRATELQNLGFANISESERKDVLNFNRKREFLQSKLMHDWDKKKTQQLDKIVWSDVLAKQQKDIDISLIQEEFVNWHSKAKTKDQKDKLMFLIKCLWRIQSYYTVCDTVADKALIELGEYKRMKASADYLNQSLNEEIKALKLKISSLEQQIEFMSNA